MLSVGIVGLPNVGKSTLFNSLTSNEALAANYPFATIDPNVGVVNVPDARLEELHRALYPDSPLVHADIRFTDIAGLVAGASEGEGLGNQFLSNIRDTAAIVQVVRAFEDENVTHVSRHIDPARDIETINTELILADLATLRKRIQSIEKAAESDKDLTRDLSYLQELEAWLDQGKLSTLFVQDNPLEKAKISHDTTTLLSQLLTAKPMVYVFNVDENGLQDDSKKQELADTAAPHQSLFVCAQLESELQDLNEAEAHDLLGEYGQNESGLLQLIRIGYDVLGLQSFYTAGEKEVRAWTIKQDSSTPQAAGTIHSDFERGFIAASIINWQQLIDAGSWAEARKQGLVRTEGKDYHMQDGDVAEFRFNV